MRIRVLVSVGAALVAFAFIVQNSGPVEVRFLFWTVEIPHVLLMVLMLLIGALLSWLLNGYFRLRRR